MCECQEQIARKKTNTRVTNIHYCRKSSEYVEFSNIQKKTLQAELSKSTVENPSKQSYKYPVGNPPSRVANIHLKTLWTKLPIFSRKIS